MSYVLGEFKINKKKLRDDIVDCLLTNPFRSDYHVAIISHLFTRYYHPVEEKGDPSVEDLSRSSFKNFIQPKADENVRLSFHDRPDLVLRSEHLRPKRGIRSGYRDRRENLDLRLKERGFSYKDLKEKLKQEWPTCFITSKNIAEDDDVALLFLPPNTDIRLLEHKNFSKSTNQLQSLIDSFSDPKIVLADALSENPGFIDPSLR